MNAMISVPMPVLASVKSEASLQVRVTWKESLRPHEEDVVDLSPLINSFKMYRPLRKNKDLFRDVRVSEDGNAISWGDGSIDMSATAIERLAEEAMTADELRKFIVENHMTHAEMAAALGYGRRQIEGFLSGKNPIPRVVALACYGFEARKLRAKMGVPLKGGTHSSVIEGEPTTRTQKALAVAVTTHGVIYPDTDEKVAA